MSKFLDVKAVAQLQDYAHSRYFVQLKPGDTYADLFVPTFWAYHRHKLKDNDLIRIKSHDGSFDVTITVKEAKIDGVVMQRWPVEPSAEDIAKAKEIGNAERYVPYGPDGKPVVRVEHLAATGWRVMGLNGQISEGHKDEPAALKAMVQYLKDIRYAMPTVEDQEKELKAHLARTAAEEERQRLKRERRQAMR